MTSLQTPPLVLPNDQDASGRMLGEKEIALLAAAIESGTLTSTKGTFVKQLESDFAELLGVKHAFACSSGSAAVHAAIAALDPEPGDEVITTSITDMGALTPILYQSAIPVFADVDPETYNITAETIRARISERTKAILATHLFGNPCDMQPICDLAARHGVPIIEDCAQAYLATERERPVGQLGEIGCFSLQQGKHITTGEGGLVVTNDDALARRMFLFINKAWGYGDERPDHYFLALNYRMSELQGAVAAAQLTRLREGVDIRIRGADQLTALLADLPGIQTPQVRAESVHTYWRYCLNVDSQIVPGGSVALGQKLRALNIACAPRYIQKPAFQCEVFAQQKTFGNSRFPFTLARPEAIDYTPAHFPGTFAALDQILVLPWNERFTSEHVEFLGASIRESVKLLTEETEG